MKLRPVWFGTAIAVLLYVGVPAAAQQPTDPPAKEKVPAKGDAVLVKGCLDGPTLQSIETSMTDETGHLATPFTYQLKGDKKLLRQMREEPQWQCRRSQRDPEVEPAAGQRDPRQDRRKDQNYVWCRRILDAGSRAGSQ